MNIDTVRAAVRGQLKAIAATDLITAQAIEDAVVAGIHVAAGGDPLAEPHLFTEDEVLAMSQKTEVENAEKRAADIAADPSLNVEAPLEVPPEPAQ